MQDDGPYRGDAEPCPVTPGEPAPGPPNQGAARLLRGCVLTGASMALAATAHVAGGGHLPALPAIGLLSLGVLAAAIGLTAVRLRLPVLLAVVGLGQWLLHEAFAVLNVSAAPGATLTVAGHHGQMILHADAAMPASAMSSCVPSWAMLGSHAVASLATAWLLARGEAALWRVVAALVPTRPGRAPRLTRALLMTVPVTRPRPSMPTLGSVTSRGPPATVRGTRRAARSPRAAWVACVA